MTLRYSNTRTEWEANCFATAFLMPEDKFKKTFEACKGDIIAVARALRVPEADAKFRAAGLKLTANN